MVAEALAARGHRRVAYIGTPGRAALPAAPRRVPALCFRALGFDDDASLLSVGPGSDLFTAVTGACQRLWPSRTRRKPTAIVASTDATTVGVLRFLEDAGLKVPPRTCQSPRLRRPRRSPTSCTASLTTVVTPMCGSAARPSPPSMDTMQGGLREPHSLILPVELRLGRSTSRAGSRLGRVPNVLDSLGPLRVGLPAKAKPTRQPRPTAGVLFRRRPPWICRGATSSPASRPARCSRPCPARRPAAPHVGCQTNAWAIKPGDFSSFLAVLGEVRDARLRRVRDELPQCPGSVADAAAARASLAEDRAHVLRRAHLPERVRRPHPRGADGAREGHRRRRCRPWRPAPHPERRRPREGREGGRRRSSPRRSKVCTTRHGIADRGASRSHITTTAPSSPAGAPRSPASSAARTRRWSVSWSTAGGRTARASTWPRSSPPTGHASPACTCATSRASSRCRSARATSTGPRSRPSGRVDRTAKVMAEEERADGWRTWRRCGRPRPRRFARLFGR